MTFVERIYENKIHSEIYEFLRRATQWVGYYCKVTATLGSEEVIRLKQLGDVAWALGELCSWLSLPSEGLYSQALEQQLHSLKKIVGEVKVDDVLSHDLGMLVKGLESLSRRIKEAEKTGKPLVFGQNQYVFVGYVHLDKCENNTSV